ncbi:MAG: hypothetical protein LBB94_06990 [Clostridiales bacterium]|nr:hypothetical protein [Clostridiales bacterium]
MKYNPSWNGAGYTRPTFDNNCVPIGFDVKTSSGFEVDSAFAFDISVPFTRQTWHGRIKACRGIGASSLTLEQIAAFEEDHLRFLSEQTEAFEISHSANFCILRKR